MVVESRPPQSNLETPTPEELASWTDADVDQDPRGVDWGRFWQCDSRAIQNSVRIAFLMANLFLVGFFAWHLRQQPGSIRVGILTSTSGPTAEEDTLISSSTLAAIAALNDRGGILGRRLEPIVADCGGDPGVFAHEARRLVEEERVSVLFGGWSTSCRAAIGSVIAETDHLTIQVAPTEDWDESLPGVIGLGGVPNQRIGPATRWCLERFGPSLLVLSSGDERGRQASTLARARVQIAGDRLVVLGSERDPASGDEAYHQALRDALATQQPDAIFCVARGRARRGWESAWMSTAEQTRPPALWLATEERRVPVTETDAAGQIWVGSDLTRVDVIGTVEVGLRLWASAVVEAGTDRPDAVRQVIVRQVVTDEQGSWRIDPSTRQAWRRLRIVRLDGNGGTEAIGPSSPLIRPEPVPLIGGLPRAWTRLGNPIPITTARTFRANDGDRSGDPVRVDFAHEATAIPRD